MGTKGKRRTRSFTENEKIEAIQRVNDGETKASVARAICVPESTLRGWCKNKHKFRGLTRISSGRIDKRNVANIPDEKVHTVSPPRPESSPTHTSGLDLSSNTLDTHTAQQPTPDVPLELTTKRSESSSPTVNLQPERRPIRDQIIQTQSNPSLAAFSTQPVSRSLRSTRLPKPTNTRQHYLNVNRNHHYGHILNNLPPAELYYPSMSLVNSQYAITPTEILAAFQYNQQVFNSMISLSIGSQLGNYSVPTIPAKPAPISPIMSHLDYNTYQWFGGSGGTAGARSSPDDKVKSALLVPNKTSAENIHYPQSTNGKTDYDRNMSSTQTQVDSKSQQKIVLETFNRTTAAAELARSPKSGIENIVPTKRPHGQVKNRERVRKVLDDILFNNNQNTTYETKDNFASSAQRVAARAKALEHGERFFAWCETSNDPCLTYCQLKKLRMLLNNLRVRPTSQTTKVVAALDK